MGGSGELWQCKNSNNFSYQSKINIKVHDRRIFVYLSIKEKVRYKKEKRKRE